MINESEGNKVTYRKVDLIVNPLLCKTERSVLKDHLTCKNEGHVTVGRHTRLPQATCSRCGRRNDSIARDGVPKWRYPEWLSEFLSSEHLKELGF
jgi:hypothetical protein